MAEELSTFTLNAKRGLCNLFKEVFSPSPELGNTNDKLWVARNIDIDHTGGHGQRDGQTLRYAGTQHSLDPRGSGLYVEGSVLKKLASALTSGTTLLSLTSNNTMDYSTGAGMTFFTNRFDIGYYKDSVAQLFAFPATPTGMSGDGTYRYGYEIKYYEVMPAGQLIEHFNGHLYVAKGSEMYCSLPMGFQLFDTRNKKKRFKGYIKLMASVDDGMFVSDSTSIYWLSGGRPEDLTMRKVADYPAIQGAYIQGERSVAGDGIKEKIVYFLTTKGIGVGTSGGSFTNVTYRKYQLSGTPQYGSALLRESNGIPQFIAVGII